MRQKGGPCRGSVMRWKGGSGEMAIWRKGVVRKGSGMRWRDAQTGQCSEVVGCPCGVAWQSGGVPLWGSVVRW